MKLVHACRHWTQAQALHTKWAPDIIDCMFACMKCNGKDYIPSGHLTISTHTCHSKPTAAVHLCNAASLPDAVTVVCRSASTYGLAAGQYNDLATPFMSMPGDTIRYIFSVEGGSKGRQDYTVCNETSACHFTPRSLGILCAFYLMLMALASGVAVPGGLFMPSIMVSLLPSIIISLCLLSWSVFAFNHHQSLPSIMVSLCLLSWSVFAFYHGQSLPSIMVSLCLQSSSVFAFYHGQSLPSIMVSLCHLLWSVFAFYHGFVPPAEVFLPAVSLCQEGFSCLLLSISAC